MNPDNPYAAPQTVETPQSVAPLPVAKSRGELPGRRRQFYDWDTARLMALLERSQAIDDMQSGWLVMCFVIPIMAFVFALSIAVYEIYFDQTRGIIGLCAVCLTFTRFATGFARTRFNRIINMVMDALLGLSCATLLVGFSAALFTEPGGALVMLFVIPITTMIGLQALRSIRATLAAPELFGPERITHDALVDEVAYRKQHNIV
jgi:hypothetical protein